MIAWSACSETVSVLTSKDSIARHNTGVNVMHRAMYYRFSRAIVFVLNLEYPYFSTHGKCYTVTPNFEPST